jgi:hypothetical protein
LYLIKPELTNPLMKNYIKSVKIKGLWDVNGESAVN